MHFNMVLPGLEEVRILKTEEIGEAYHLHIELPKRKHKCPACGNRTSRIHDYRLHGTKATGSSSRPFLNPLTQNLTL
jgi:transposase